MIRIHLGPEGLGNVRIGARPDFDAELTAAGVAHARGARPHDPLAQLYSRSTSPDLAEGISPLYLSHLFARRSPTPFTKALAEGDDRARGVLDRAVDRLRDTALDPRRPSIGSAVAARAAGWSHLSADSGASAMLHRLGHGIRLRRGVLEVPTAFDTDLELGERSLRIQPVALSRRVTLAEPANDHLTVRIPAGSPPRTEPGQLAALRSLLGAGRAETLAAIVTSGGATGRQLAALLGVSDAVVSRHAAALRRAGVIQSLRMGQAVKHVATSLGYQLLSP
ncbi:MarR family transcriptional regulator [Kibdelosporangium lantanae]